ncbi:MAG: hypothetical protein OSA97_01580 [Nevskia sp.]|nr:hypothetical protein [Nevskia sp.]
MSDTTASQPQLLDGRAAFAAKALEVVRGAHHELLLLSDSLERGLYGGEEFYDAVKGFLLGNERARLCVYVNQPQGALQNVPRLLELNRRVSSRFEFREPSDEQKAGSGNRSEWLLADRRVLLERLEPESLQAQFWAQEPQRGKLRGEAFDTLWNEAQPAQELRSLGL